MANSYQNLVEWSGVELRIMRCRSFNSIVQNVLTLLCSFFFLLNLNCCIFIVVKLTDGNCVQQKLNCFWVYCSCHLVNVYVGTMSTCWLRMPTVGWIFRPRADFIKIITDCWTYRQCYRYSESCRVTAPSSPYNGRLHGWVKELPTPSVPCGVQQSGPWQANPCLDVVKSAYSW